MREESCENCRFFKPVGSKAQGIYGHCRRKPPVVVTVRARSVARAGSLAPVRPATVWPQVLPQDWCGEHKLTDRKLGQVKQEKETIMPLPRDPERLARLSFKPRTRLTGGRHPVLGEKVILRVADEKFNKTKRRNSYIVISKGIIDKMGWVPENT